MIIIHIQTYGPFTRNYEQPSWIALNLEQRARLIAQQGHAFATAEEARVVYASPDGTGPLKDVPRDGKTVGEIVTRGNIVMKEVCSPRSTMILDQTISLIDQLSVLQRSRGYQKSLPRRKFPYWRFGCNASQWLRCDYGQEQRYHHFWWRGEL